MSHALLNISTDVPFGTHHREFVPRPMRERRTGAHASRFEIARIQALRAQQIHSGMASTTCTEHTSTSAELNQIVHEEMKQQQLRVSIGRPLPDGTMRWVRLVEDLDIDQRAFVQPHVHS